jgi:hypothetical protein
VTLVIRPAGRHGRAAIGVARALLTSSLDAARIGCGAIRVHAALHATERVAAKLAHSAAVFAVHAAQRAASSRAPSTPERRETDD